MSIKKIEKFEEELSKFTGAPYVVATDSGTHAVELGLRYQPPKMYASIPETGRLSVLMTFKKLGMSYMLSEDEWDNYYHISGTLVVDCPRYFKEDMFKAPPAKTRLMCISLKEGPFSLPSGGAILTNSKKAYEWIKRAVNDGLDPHLSIEEQKEIFLGYHYMMSDTIASSGLRKLKKNDFEEMEVPGHKYYPNLNNLKIIEEE